MCQYQKERFLCNFCLQDFETSHKTMGLNRVYSIILENHEEISKLRFRVINHNIQQLDQLKQYQILLNQNQMIEITKNWISSFDNYQEGSFFKGLDLLIKNELTIDNNKIVEEINYLNNQQIEKVKMRLEQFKSFKQYIECEKVLNDLKVNTVLTIDRIEIFQIIIIIIIILYIQNKQ
ncbi:unnamed protein product [Paramecium sonneborni]|uniref:Uncharacterized protein n=1 Tax=Paramecium sonneborni TaxID=65129 RepID=A0A8S1R7G8_9CILI|nr:unnamed protein product [Paramecium sonneborni]